VLEASDDFREEVFSMVATSSSLQPIDAPPGEHPEAVLASEGTAEAAGFAKLTGFIDASACRRRRRREFLELLLGDASMVTASSS
jgi:hypothetical protein